MFEAVLKGFARAAYEALDWQERAQVDHVIHLIELDPRIDNVYKAEILVPPLVLTAYDNGAWHIVYRVVDDRFIEVYGINRVRPA